jgi:hypothetical protein
MEKLFYITSQPSAKHSIIEFPSPQCNILKTVCTRPAKNVIRMFYLAMPSPHVFVMLEFNYCRIYIPAMYKYIWSLRFFLDT